MAAARVRPKSICAPELRGRRGLTPGRRKIIPALCGCVGRIKAACDPGPGSCIVPATAFSFQGSGGSESTGEGAPGASLWPLPACAKKAFVPPELRGAKGG